MLIDISSISLDIENFRHGHVSTEREAIQKLLSDEKSHRVAELAEDIVSMKGLDPSSLLIVTADPTNAGHYVALEGNRRMTALKTLINPELAVNLSTYAAFKKLSPKFMGLGIQKVECVVQDRKHASDWIKRKHYNAMGGRGVMPWNAIATARSDAAEGRPSRWVMVLNLLASQGEQTEQLLDGIASKTTTVDRVFASSHMSTVLGITFDSKTALPVAESGDNKAAANLLKAMLTAMADKSFTEPSVTTADLQRVYLERFEHLNVRKKALLPSRGTGTGTASGTGGAGSGAPGAAGGLSSSPGGAGGSSAQPATATGVPPARSKPVRFRNKLAEKGLRINNSALNKLYGELRKLNVETNPHIGSAMVRVFLEKATLVFLEDMSIPSKNPNGWRDFGIKLKDKVAAALHSIDPQKKDPRLQYARDVSNGVQGKLHTLDNLNHAIHDHASLPSARDIITIWDRYHPYLEEIFKTLEKNGK